MADITMCGSTTCPIKDGCKRHTAVPNKDWQSWCDFSSHVTVGINGYECDNFIAAYKIITSNDSGNK